MNKITEQDALTIISQSVDLAIDRLKQKIVASVDAGGVGVIGSQISCFQEQIVSRVCGLYDGEFTAQVKRDMTIMPPGTRFFTSSGGRAVLITETPPSQRTLLIQKAAEYGHQRSSELHHKVATPRNYALPYVYFVFQLEKTTNNSDWTMARLPATFWRTKPLRHISDRMYHSLLSNSNHGEICMGHVNQGFTQKPFGVGVEEFTALYWQSEFTGDYSDEMHRAIVAQRPFKSLEEWAEKSKNNPTFILKEEEALNKANTCEEIINAQLGTAQERFKDFSALCKRVVFEEAETLSIKLTQHLKSLDARAMHKSQHLVRNLADYISDQVDSKTRELAQMYEGKFADALRELERKEDEFMANLLRDKDSEIPLSKRPRAVAGLDLTNPW